MKSYAIKHLEEAKAAISVAIAQHEMEMDEQLELFDRLKAQCSELIKANKELIDENSRLIRMVQNGQDAANKGSNRGKRSGESLQEARVRSAQKRHAAVAEKHRVSGRDGGVRTSSVDRSQKRRSNKTNEGARSGN